MLDNKELDDAIEKQAIINQQARNDKKIAKITGSRRQDSAARNNLRQKETKITRMDGTVEYFSG